MDRYDKKQKKRVQQQHTAMLIPLEIFKGDLHVGKGFFLVREDGIKSYPFMWNDEDEELPEGDYRIAACTMVQHLCVVPRRIQ